MSTKIRLYQIADNKLIPLKNVPSDSNFLENPNIRKWLSMNPEVIEEGLRVIGVEVQVGLGFIDILALDEDSNTVVIELKRDEIPRDVIGQAIDYASSIAGWTYADFNEVYRKHVSKQSAELETDFGLTEPSKVQRIILVGFEVHPSVQRMTEWLAEQFGVPIEISVLAFGKLDQDKNILASVSLTDSTLNTEAQRGGGSRSLDTNRRSLIEAIDVLMDDVQYNYNLEWNRKKKRYQRFFTIKPTNLTFEIAFSGTSPIMYVPNEAMWAPEVMPILKDAGDRKFTQDSEYDPSKATETFKRFLQLMRAANVQP